MPTRVLSFAVRRAPTFCAKGCSACDACAHVRTLSQIPIEAARALKPAGPTCSTVKKARASLRVEDGVTGLAIECGDLRALQQCSCQGFDIGRWSTSL